MSYHNAMFIGTIILVVLIILMTIWKKLMKISKEADKKYEQQLEEKRRGDLMNKQRIISNFIYNGVKLIAVNRDQNIIVNRDWGNLYTGDSIELGWNDPYSTEIGGKFCNREYRGYQIMDIKIHAKNDPPVSVKFYPYPEQSKEYEKEFYFSEKELNILVKFIGQYLKNYSAKSTESRANQD